MHADSSSTTAVSIPSPCLLGINPVTLTCTVNLASSNVQVQSEANSKEHLKGQLSSHNLQAAPTPGANATTAVTLLDQRQKRSVPAVTSMVADQRLEYSSGHWSHPAVLDCSLHLAAALAVPAGQCIILGISESATFRDHDVSQALVSIQP